MNLHGMHRYEPRIHPQHILDDCLRFRELMGRRDSDPEELQQLFTFLVGASVMARSTRQHPDATKAELERVQSATDALMVEWPMRYAMMVVGPMTKSDDEVGEEIVRIERQRQLQHAEAVLVVARKT